MKTKKIFGISVALGLILSVVLLNLTAFAKECRTVRENTLRLHIIANSDSDEDQALKLLIRDRILEETGGIFLETENIDASVSMAEEKMEEIVSFAREEIEKAGKSYEASGEICEMFFDTKVYGDVTMPAGRYKALRIKIGESTGKNWWCVLFPPLCLSSCVSDNESLEILEPMMENGNYRVKFYFVELIERVKEWFK